MPDSLEGSKIYLIERVNESADCRYYAEHGELDGVSDAIGYDESPHARKFRTESEAQNFLRNQLPEWAQELHKVVGFSFADFLPGLICLASMLWYGIKIPDELLEPTAGRLRIWRVSEIEEESA